MHPPVIRQAGEGERLWFAGGGLFTTKVSSADSGGALFALEDRVVRGKTTPLHMHPAETEFMYVLEARSLRTSPARSTALVRAASSSFLVAFHTRSWSRAKRRSS